MTQAAAVNKLKKAGYKVTFAVQGGVMATKGQNTYRAETINQLIKRIFH